MSRDHVNKLQLTVTEKRTPELARNVPNWPEHPSANTEPAAHTAAAPAAAALCFLVQKDVFLTHQPLFFF